MSYNKSDKIRLQVLFLTYGDKYKEAFAIFKTYLNNLYEFCNINILVIDNKNEKCPNMILDINHYLHYRMYGDNSSYEFSGWDIGIKHLEATNEQYDLCLFINDSFVTNDYFQNKKLLSIETVEKCIKNNAMVGKLDRLDRQEEHKGLEYTVNNRDVTSWIRTNAFYLTKDIIDDLKQLTTVTKNTLTDYVAEYCNESSTPFLKCANISIFLQCQMIKYFTKFWHSARPINEENWDTWKFKVLSMINEKLLTRRVIDLCFEVLNYE